MKIDLSFWYDEENQEARPGDCAEIAGDANIMLFNTAGFNGIHPDWFVEFFSTLQDLIDGKHEQGGIKHIWAHSSSITYEDGYFFLYDRWGDGPDDGSDIVVKIKPLEFIRYLWHYVRCQMEKSEQVFTLELEVLPYDRDTAPI